MNVRSITAVLGFFKHLYKILKKSLINPVGGAVRPTYIQQTYSHWSNGPVNIHLLKKQIVKHAKTDRYILVWSARNTRLDSLKSQPRQHRGQTFAHARVFVRAEL